MDLPGGSRQRQREEPLLGDPAPPGPASSGQVECPGAVRPEFYREVTIVVSYHTQQLQLACLDPRLFPEFATGRGTRGLSCLDLTPGKLPETSQKPVFRSALDIPPSGPLDYHYGGSHSRRAPLRRTAGKAVGSVELLFGAAVPLNGTIWATRRPRSAKGLPKLHQGLIEPVREGPGKNPLQILLEAPLDLSGANVSRF